MASWKARFWLQVCCN